MIKAYLIDPVRQEIEKVSVSIGSNTGDFDKVIGDMLEANQIGQVKITDWDKLYVNKNAVVNTDALCFNGPYFHQPVFGKALLIGTHPGDIINLAGPAISLDVFKRNIYFFDRSMTNLYREDPGAIREIMKSLRNTEKPMNIQTNIKRNRLS